MRLTLKTELHWLGGFPVAIEDGAVRFVVVPRGSDRDVEEVRVDRPRLSRARRAANELLRDHHAGLARVVGDVDRWSRRIDAALALLKPSVDDGRALAAAPIGLPPRARSPSLSSTRSRGAASWTSASSLAI